MRALIINPNTSAIVTTKLCAHLTPLLPGWQLEPVTARFGGNYIASEAGYAIAAHAVLDAWSTVAPTHDALLVGCFGDPGLAALREVSGKPCVGLAEAAMREASARGSFAIVTGGERWASMLQRLAAGMGLSRLLRGIRVLPQSGGELLAEPDGGLKIIGDAAREAQAGFEVESVIIGGAALAGIGDRLADQLGFAVIDNVSAAARALQNGSNALPAIRDTTRFSGLSAELGARLTCADSDIPYAAPRDGQSL